MSAEAPSLQWNFDPQVRSAVLLSAAKRALMQGDATMATALAEEVLEEDPEDVEALLLIADAAPRYNHGRVGLVAAEQAAQRGADVGALLAVARLAVGDVQEALQEAESILRMDPSSARAMAVRGQALELLGRWEEAEAALESAALLRPDLYPRSTQVPPDDWNGLVQAALESLEEEDQRTLADTEMVFAALPELHEVRRAILAPGTLCRVQAGKPRRLVLYQRNLSRGIASPEELRDRIAQTLAWEAASLRSAG